MANATPTATNDKNQLYFDVMTTSPLASILLLRSFGAPMHRLVDGREIYKTHFGSCIYDRANDTLSKSYKSHDELLQVVK